VIWSFLAVSVWIVAGEGEVLRVAGPLLLFLVGSCGGDLGLFLLFLCGLLLGVCMGGCCC